MVAVDPATPAGTDATRTARGVDGAQTIAASYVLYYHIVMELTSRSTQQPLSETPTSSRPSDSRTATSAGALAAGEFGQAVTAPSSTLPSLWTTSPSATSLLPSCSGMIPALAEVSLAPRTARRVFSGMLSVSSYVPFFYYLDLELSGPCAIWTLRSSLGRGRSQPQAG